MHQCDGTGKTLTGWDISSILSSFTGVKRFHVSGSHSTQILQVLQLPERQHKKLLPALQMLLVSQPGPNVREAAVSFMVSRRLSGYPIAVEYERLFHICEPGGAGTISAQCYCRQHSLSRLK